MPELPEVKKLFHTTLITFIKRSVNPSVNGLADLFIFCIFYANVANFRIMLAPFVSPILNASREIRFDL